MNIYFIVEGRRTEKKVYPAWLNYLIPRLKRVQFSNEAAENNYYLFNGNGFPALLNNHLRNSIDDLNEIKIYDYLVLILDVDDVTVEDRIKEVKDFISKDGLQLDYGELIIIPQNRTIETWFLGNKNIFKNNPQSATLVEYTKFYNVKTDDPELMGKFKGFNTHAQFHSDYCVEFLRERKISYSKNFPNEVIEEHYLNSLIERQKETSHLSSFENFLNFCNIINLSITKDESEKKLRT